MTAQEPSDNPHFLGLSEATTMNTVGFAATQTLFSDMLALNAIGLIHGEAGLGKTFATNYACLKAGIPVTRATAEPGMTLKRLVDRVLVGVTGVPALGTRFQLQDDLVEKLSDRRRLIVLDEAQLLSHICLETMRALHDKAETCFTLVLVGGNGCWELIERHPMLCSRILSRVQIEPLTNDDVFEVIPDYHPIYAGSAQSTLERINKRFARGNFREWAAFTLIAKQICDRDGGNTVTNRVADETLDRIGRITDA